MSVVGDKVIFCEGKQTSLDFRLINRVLENLSINKPTIVPSGSKFTFSVFVEGYFSRSETINKKYIVFRDRDFDVKPTDNIQLIPIGSMLLTHRACVENYLLDSNLIHNYWVTRYIEKQNNPISRWGHGDSPGIAAISTWIEQAAKSLQDYQVVRWALADLIQLSASRQQLRTTWTGGSGKLPSLLTLQHCQSEALTLINQFQQATSIVTQDRFLESIAAYQQHFSQPNFWSDRQYLIWFHGKDIQKAMQQQQSQYISLNPFFDWALNQINVNEHPDLIELQNRIALL
ncbi:hypothetical protein DSM106972_015580 [Dulcicalothrix desertica PCC 7102]|uniref:DUF4435 domain-containing protein n=1 Tax=Dulcicalothrix desertica PCC 7102 TaxID=232991 RepID=A0A433VQK1_9CYAN|nr:hypothetical protein [Dulcicalothrix desertica]RUT08390.1 hypothetical protein DSM106972_015580 [Dulcicalothrix desertica PCC 7102]TWH40255.1 hypothetical protein CAL7102_09560 [Dulcicalothrix desertica PCC 7102]